MDWNDLSNFGNAVGVYQLQVAKRIFTMMLLYPRTLLLITSLFLLVGGSEKIADNKSVVIDVDRTVLRDGLRYEVDPAPLNESTP